MEDALAPISVRGEKFLNSKSNGSPAEFFLRLKNFSCYESWKKNLE
jgi:hypothetical protein